MVHILVHVTVLKTYLHYAKAAYITYIQTAYIYELQTTTRAVYPVVVGDFPYKYYINFCYGIVLE